MKQLNVFENIYQEKNKTIKNVLSLFDGMSGGQIALNRAGISYKKYYASEVDKYAIQIAQKNYPDTIQLGDITNIISKELPKIDLLIGGSPCQGFSVAGKRLNFEDERSKLFFEFVRILEEVKPKFFLLENVKMKKEYEDIITGYMKVNPILINSSLVSAQNRKRLYWTNIPNVTQPEDKGILLKDILDDSINQIGAFRGRYVKTKNGDIKTEQQLELATEGKSNALTTVQKDNLVVDRDKSYCIDANYWKGANYKQYRKKHRRQLVGCIQVGEADIKGYDCIKRVYSKNGKSPTLTTCEGGHREPKVAIDNIKWRKLTPTECERLQTVDIGYTEEVSNTQRYKMLGNGFTIDVIAHILKGLK